MDGPYTAAVADYIARSRFEGLPPSVVEHTTRQFAGKYK